MNELQEVNESMLWNFFYHCNFGLLGKKKFHVLITYFLARKNSETELKSLIDKYDEDMNRKQCELENLMAQFEKEKLMYIELKVKF